MNSHDAPGRSNREMRDWHPTFSKFVPLFPAFLHVGFSDPHSLLNPYSICCYIYDMTGEKRKKNHTLDNWLCLLGKKCVLHRI